MQAICDGLWDRAGIAQSADAYAGYAAAASDTGNVDPEQVEQHICISQVTRVGFKSLSYPSAYGSRQPSACAYSQHAV